MWMVHSNSLFQILGGQREYELILDTTGSALAASLAGTTIRTVRWTAMRSASPRG
jgi:hypothetical protein